MTSGGFRSLSDFSCLIGRLGFHSLDLFLRIQDQKRISTDLDWMFLDSGPVLKQDLEIGSGCSVFQVLVFRSLVDTKVAGQHVLHNGISARSFSYGYYAWRGKQPIIQKKIYR